MSRIIIVGGGAAGMACAVFLAEAGCEVLLAEKNGKLGKKVYITGKGRCNFTNACPEEELMENVVRNRRFLYSAFCGFDNRDAVNFFERLGVRTKTERGGRIFPASDHASDIILAMERRMRWLGVRICLNTEVKRIDGSVGDFRITMADGREETCGAVVIATGGLSYPLTGSTGDGYRFASEAGHTIAACAPSLVPLETAEPLITRMQGLSLRNVTLRLGGGKKQIYEGFGELLFTHFGISGPLALTASAVCGPQMERGEVPAEIDWKPALSEQQLDGRLLREFEGRENRMFRNVLPALLPAKAVPVFLDAGPIESERRVREITRKERQDLIRLLKHFSFTVTGTRGFQEAIVTRGGVAVKEISPKTMESKKKKGLYFIGEVLDVDALTGGFNLQIAWSTAHAAAEALSGTGMI